MKRVLLDHNVPHALAMFLRATHTTTEAHKRGWEKIQNGKLLSEGEAAGFDVLVTADKNLSYQQNHAKRTISLVVLECQEWEFIEAYVERVLDAIDSSEPGSFAFVEIPRPPKKRR